jgi:hypothetical protein
MLVMRKMLARSAARMEGPACRCGGYTRDKYDNTRENYFASGVGPAGGETHKRVFGG